MSEKTININGRTVIVTVTKSEYSMHFKPNIPLKKEEATDVQKSLGYPVQGYGFDSFRAVKSGSAWSCGLSCD